MSRRLGALLAAVAATALFAITLAPLEVEAQERGRIMVINMTPTDGSSDRFGQRAADNLRGLIDLPTHRGMSSRDIDQAARQFDMRLNSLDCVSARQLAAQVQVPLVMCADYAADGNQYRVEVSFYAVPAMEEYPMEPFTVAQNDERGTAQQILSHLEVLIQQDQYVSWCGAEFGSENWQQALEYCTRAVEVAPQSTSARFALAMTYRNLERFEEAMELFEGILEIDAWDPNALENAGWVAAQLGDTDKARGYYTRYLEINPGSASVRVRIAFDLSQAGDYQGAVDLLADGLAQDPDHVGLLEQYGSNLFLLAEQMRVEQIPTQDGDRTITPEMARLYREAIETLMRVVEIEGEEARSSFVINSVRAYVQLAEYEDAIRTADRGLQIFPGDAGILSEKATVLNRMGEVDDAVTTLRQALQVNPDLANARARMGNYLIAAGRVEEGIEYLKEAVEAGEQNSEQMAQLVFNEAYQRGINNNQNLARGITLIESAKQFEVSTQFREQLDFWHGFAIFQQAIVRQEPQTVESARATTPMFNRARDLMRAGGGYANRTQGINLQGFMENIEAYLDIQDAIIRRGGGR